MKDVMDAKLGGNFDNFAARLTGCKNVEFSETATEVSPMFLPFGAANYCPTFAALQDTSKYGKKYKSISRKLIENFIKT